jgi:hypothetical protein
MFTLSFVPSHVYTLYNMSGGPDNMDSSTVVGGGGGAETEREPNRI